MHQVPYWFLKRQRWLDSVHMAGMCVTLQQLFVQRSTKSMQSDTRSLKKRGSCKKEDSPWRKKTSLAYGSKVGFNGVPDWLKAASAAASNAVSAAGNRAYINASTLAVFLNSLTEFSL